MPLFYFYIGVACIPTLISYILPESPRYLMSRHLFKEARESFNQIASMNQQSNLCLNTEKLLQELELDNKQKVHVIDTNDDSYF